ncbi:pheromone autoinducer 2 transporter [Vibrio inusitatus NBRC 102082]|uniref:Pheromone autoinducer 2 transporter n=1 Tax=Vibrio inusitatus NBRC 102082 TaxID=1219070 RepID=A0A4Y3HTR0_9VIBR|nr:AI-2E family transporter [Vibrio inusitatus]GEA49684.1 pheromone autoinducer 2 transporter [Vibrio inusitatus NBRC 102082]
MPLSQPNPSHSINVDPQSLTWVNIAAITIVLTAVKFFDGVLAPLLVSVFIAFAVYPVITLVKRVKIPHVAASLLVMLFFLAELGTLGGVLGNSTSDILVNIDSYQLSLQKTLSRINLYANRVGLPIDLSLVNIESLFATTEQSMLNVASKAGNTMSNFMIILVTTGFIVTEAPVLHRKLHRHIHSEKMLVSIDKFVHSMNRYLLAKSTISLGKAVLVGGILWGFEVEYYVLIAVLVFLLNFIPNIGPLLAAAPLTVCVLLQTGINETLVIISLYFGINFVVGNFVEPKLLGSKLGLSPLIVFLSLLFWGWLLGPVGLILSVPLTMAVKICFESSSHYQHLSEVMG